MVVNPNDTVGDIKDKIEDLEGIPAKEQRLLFDGEPLTDNDKPILDCDIYS